MNEREVSLLDENEYSRWIKSAEKTLESAIVDHDHGFYNWSCFKAHQVAEKALKAILWGIGRPCFGHSLTTLLNKLNEFLGNIPESIREYVVRLNKYYIPTRYPDAWVEGLPEEQYSERESREAIDMASEILRWVRETWVLLKRE